MANKVAHYQNTCHVAKWLVGHYYSWTYHSVVLVLVQAGYIAVNFTAGLAFSRLISGLRSSFIGAYMYTHFLPHQIRLMHSVAACYCFLIADVVLQIT